MKWRLGAGETFVIGLCLGTVFSLVALAMGSDRLGDGTAEYVVGLLTIVATLAAAVVAWRAVQHQIAVTREYEERRREGSFRASSALLPLALSSMMEACSSNVRRNFHGASVHFGPPPPTSMTPFPPDTVQVLRDAIEFASDDLYKELRYAILAYQVLAARDVDVASHHALHPGSLHVNRVGDVLNWSALGAILGNILEYIRGDTTSISPLTGSQVRGGIRASGVLLDEFPEIVQRLAVREAQDRLRLRF